MTETDALSRNIWNALDELALEVNDMPDGEEKRKLRDQVQEARRRHAAVVARHETEGEAQ